MPTTESPTMGSTGTDEATGLANPSGITRAIAPPSNGKCTSVADPSGITHAVAF